MISKWTLSGVTRYVALTGFVYVNRYWNWKLSTIELFITFIALAKRLPFFNGSLSFSRPISCRRWRRQMYKESIIWSKSVFCVDLNQSANSKWTYKTKSNFHLIIQCQRDEVDPVVTLIWYTQTYRSVYFAPHNAVDDNTTVITNFRSRQTDTDLTFV